MKRRRPRSANDGIQIGSWKTFVKGLYVDTFALGGDTAVHYDYDGNLFLENYRIMPLCMLAANYSGVIEQLATLKNYPTGHTLCLYEFFVLMKDITDDNSYSDEERVLCWALKNGPLMLPFAAKAIGQDVYSFKTARLESEGIILRAGLTPTDIMHIRGDFTEFDRSASWTAAQFAAAYSHTSMDSLCQKVYNMVEEKLYCNLVRIFMQTSYPALKCISPDMQLDALIHLSYQQAKSSDDAYFTSRFTTKAVLVGVGAPTHIFLSSVASLLGTTAVIPEHASVANAIGAIVGNISATACAELKPNYEGDIISGFRVITTSHSIFCPEYEDALNYARDSAKTIAISQAKEQGAVGSLSISFKSERKEADIAGSALFLNEIIYATATGKAF